MLNRILTTVRRLPALAVIVLAACVGTSSLNAATLTYSGLEGLTVGGINGQNDNPTQWAYPWDVQNGNTKYTVQNTAPLTFGNLATSSDGNYLNGGGDFVSMGRRLATGGGSVWDSNGFESDPWTAGQIDQGTVWVSFLLRVNSTITSWDHAQIAFHGNATPWQFSSSAGLEIATVNNSSQWAVRLGDSGTATTLGSVSVGQTVFVVIKFELSLTSGANNAYVWMFTNPNAAGLGGADLSTGSATASITGKDTTDLRFKAIGLYLDNAQNRISMDEFRFGTDYASVSPVPAVTTTPTTTTLGSSPNPSTTGQSVTFTATIQTNGTTATGVTGNVVFKDGGTAVYTNSSIASGVATYTTSALTAGTHAFTAVYSGDVDFATSTSAATNQTVNSTLATTTTTLGSSPSPSTAGQAVTFTATIQTNGVTATDAGGNVVFKDGGTTVYTGSIANGVATYTTSGLTAGTHAFTAVYSGDSNYATSTSAATNQTVNAIPPVAKWDWTADPVGTGSDVWPGFNGPAAFTSAQSPSYYTYGTPVPPSGSTPGTSNPTLNPFTVPTGVTVSSLGYGSGLYPDNASGAIQACLAGGAHVDCSTVANAQANNCYFTFTVQVAPGYKLNLGSITLAAGKYSLSDYSGSSYVYSSADNFTTALGSGTNGWIWDQYHTFAGPSYADYAHTVSPYTVNLSGQSGLQNLTAASGPIEFRIYVPVTAYSGDVGLQNVELNGTIAALPATTTALSAPANSCSGDGVLLTATVQTNGNTATAATGNVVFQDGGTPISTNSVVNGVATGTATGLSAGAHSLTAVYSGDTAYAGSTSAVANNTVHLPPTVVTPIALGAQSGVAQTLLIIGGKHAPSGTGTLTVSGKTDGAHGSVATDGSSLTYTPTAGYVGSDSFTYTVSDSNGCSTVGTVNVNVSAVGNQQSPTITFNGNDVDLTFWGVPGTNYTIQVSSNLGANWTDLTPDVVASLTQPYGRILFTNNPSPGSGSGFYRLKP